MSDLPVAIASASVGFAAAAEQPDLLAPVKLRRGLAGFAWRHPAIAIGGAVVTESVFAIPGLGRLTIDAILRRDYPVIQGIVLLFSFLYVLVNLMVDLTYTLVDPRIRY